MRELLAQVQFRGVIRERTVEPYVRILRALRSKNRVRGVLLDISSGGGADIPSTDLYLAVKRLDAVKPVYASIGSIGASGGYMAALGARRVFAYADSGVGSIGVVFPHIAVQELLHRIGVSVELVHEGRHKDAYQGLRPLTEEERAKLQAVTRDSYDSFVDLVARERRMSVDQVRALATGEFWSGRKALELGLIDALADREQAMEELSRLTGVPTRRAVRVVPPRPFFERLVSGPISAMGTGFAGGVRDAVEESVWDLVMNRRY